MLEKPEKIRRIMKQQKKTMHKASDVDEQLEYDSSMDEDDFLLKSWIELQQFSLELT